MSFRSRLVSLLWVGAALETLAGCGVTLEYPVSSVAPVAVASKPSATAAGTIDPVPAVPVPTDVLPVDARAHGGMSGRADDPLGLEQALREATSTLMSTVIRARRADAGMLMTIGVTALYELDTTERLRGTLRADRLLQSTLRESFEGRPLAILRQGELSNADWILVGGPRSAAAVRDGTGRLGSVPMCLGIIERGSGRLIARHVSWLRVDDIDLVPIAFHLDFPMQVRRAVAVDPDVLCDAGSTTPADVSMEFLFALESIVAIDEAIGAYEGGAYDEAARTLEQEAEVGGAASLLPLSGVALTSVRQRRRDPARAALDRWVRLALRTGPVWLAPPPAAVVAPSSPAGDGFDAARWYREVVAVIGATAARMGVCLMIVPYPAASSVAAPAPDDPSLQRAVRIRTMLLEGTRLRSSSLVIVTAMDGRRVRALGSDDARDRWDRRTEIGLRGCGK